MCFIRKKIKLFFISVSILLVLSLLLTSKTACAEKVTEVPAKKIEVKFYYSNACAACHEEKNFEDIARRELKDIADSYPHEIWTYNCFRPEDQKKYKEELDIHGWDMTQAPLPLLVIGDQMVSGEKQIEQQLHSLYQKEVSLIRQAEKMIYFSTVSCSDCKKVKALLKQYGVEAEEYGIEEAENLQALYQYFERYGVKEKEQQVPIIFWKNKYYSGVEEIKKAFKNSIEEASERNETALAAEDKFLPTLSWKDCGKVLLTGLVNGLNPCSASLLLFLLSLFAVSGLSVKRVGFSYLAGRFLSYLLAGVGIFSVGTYINERLMGTVTVIVSAVFLVLAVILGGLNLLDYIHVKRQEYEKVILQLPKPLKHWNYNKIKIVRNISLKWLMPAVFILGFVISAGEFFCTGQIYAAVILSMIKEKMYYLKALILLLLYVTAMCAPHAVIICIVDKKKAIADASQMSTKQIPYYKLFSAFLFLGFAVWIFYSM